MNQIHEQCPKIDSGTVLSQNLVKNRLGAPSAQPAGPGHAHGVLRPRAQLPPCRAPARLCRPAPSDQRPPALLARCVVALHGCVVTLCRDTVQQPQSQYTSNLAIQFLYSQPPVLQYNFLQQPSCSCHNTMVYCNTKFPAQSSLTWNTIIVLQYNFQA